MDEDRRPGTGPTRRRPAVAAGIVGAALVAAAVVAIFVTRAGGSGSAFGTPRFVDETGESGVAITFDGDSNYDTGGGVAVLDCDGDERPDLYVAGGAGPAGLFHNESATGGALRFTRLPGSATDLTEVLGAYPLDVDGDGNPDLAVLRASRSVLLRGLGGCRFEDATARWGADPTPAWTTAFSATWENLAQLPTLAFGNYVVQDSGGSGTYRCPDNELLRPDGSGTRYARPLALTPGFCALSMLFSDWDGSGRRDLRISNDRHYYDEAVGEEQLWHTVPGQPPRRYGTADGWRSLQIWGMGIASQDLTGDGLPEIYLTSQADNKLQTLAAGSQQPTYRDMALSTGVIGTRPVSGGDPLPSTAWHPQFEDVNNDGLLDLYVSKGNVDQIPDYAARDPSNLFLGRPDGTFAEVAADAGILDYDRSRGAALADLNSDGLLDLVEVKLRAPVHLWRNVGAGSAEEPAAMGSWLAIRLKEPGANRDAIGAMLDVRVGDSVTRRELTVGGGHISGQLGWVHAGLGRAREADVRVRWPDGVEGPWIHVAADQFLVVDRGMGQAVPWMPMAPTKTAP
jgi:hypothetical protein